VLADWRRAAKKLRTFSGRYSGGRYRCAPNASQNAMKPSPVYYIPAISLSSGLVSVLDRLSEWISELTANMSSAD
jgi:hypothetical protein